MPRRKNPTRRLLWWIPISLVEQIQTMAAEEGYRDRPGRYLSEILLPRGIASRRMEQAPTTAELAHRVYRAPGWRG